MPAVFVMQGNADPASCNVADDHTGLVGLEPLHVVLANRSRLPADNARRIGKRCGQRPDRIHEVDEHGHAVPFPVRVFDHADDVGHFCCFCELAGAEDFHKNMWARAAVFHELLHDLRCNTVLPVELGDVAQTGERERLRDDVVVRERGWQIGWRELDTIHAVEFLVEFGQLRERASHPVLPMVLPTAVLHHPREPALLLSDGLVE